MSSKDHTEIPQTEAADLCRRNCYIDPRIETVEEAPDRDAAFARIEARVMGTELAAKLVGARGP
jgi:hypothetical protein